MGDRAKFDALFYLMIYYGPTLVLEGSCCVFDAIRRQVYLGLTHFMGKNLNPSPFCEIFENKTSPV